MELSTQGLGTDGVGKLSSSLHIPVGPSQESLPLCLCLSFFFQPLFSVSPTNLSSYCFSSSGPLLCFSYWATEISFIPHFSCVFIKAGKQDDIRRIVSRVMR